MHYYCRRENQTNLISTRRVWCEPGFTHYNVCLSRPVCLSVCLVPVHNLRKKSAIESPKLVDQFEVKLRARWKGLPVSLHLRVTITSGLDTQQRNDLESSNLVRGFTQQVSLPIPFQCQEVKGCSLRWRSLTGRREMRYNWWTGVQRL